MAHTITIDAAATGMNQFVQRFGSMIHQTLTQPLELEALLPFVETEYAYQGQDVDLGGVLQPYQKAFTPNNTEDFDGIINYLKPIKADLEFTGEQLEKFFFRWRPNWFTPDPNDIRNGYASYVINNHIVPQLAEDVNLASWAGEYAAPTPGTPGAVLESVNGFKVGIEAQITASRLTPITTGAFVANTMVAQVRDFCKEIPEPYRYRSGKIFMSKTLAQQYADDYQDKYPTRLVTEQNQDQLYLRVDHYNKTIVGVSAMEGSSRIVCVFDNLESLIIGSRAGFPRYFNFRFETEDRKLKVFSEIYRFYGFETCKHMFVNDQE